jgi:hypothetical protein
MFVRMGQGAFNRSMMWPVCTCSYGALTVLVEVGIVGYRGFVSPVRYASIAVATLGVALLMFGFVMPYLLRT